MTSSEPDTQTNVNASFSTTSSTTNASETSANENTQVENSKQTPTDSTVSNNMLATTASQGSLEENNDLALASDANADTTSASDASQATSAGGASPATSSATTFLTNDTQTTHEVTVSDWSQLVSAMSNTNYEQINISGTLTATGNGDIGSVGHTVTINGTDNASIDFGSNILTATGGSWNVTLANLNVVTGNASGVLDLSKTTGENTVTFDNVNWYFTLWWGGNTTVVITGNMTSTVANAGKNNEANIHDATSVTVANGASFTIDRSSIGDGINFQMVLLL